MLVRSDLTSGTQLAQTGHAAQEATGHQPVVMIVLAVPDEETLKHYAEVFKTAGIEHAAVVEDAGPYADQLVSIGIKPTTDRAAIKELTSRLRLAGKR